MCEDAGGKNHPHGARRPGGARCADPWPRLRAQPYALMHKPCRPLTPGSANNRHPGSSQPVANQTLQTWQGQPDPPPRPDRPKACRRPPPRKGARAVPTKPKLRASTEVRGSQDPERPTSSNSKPGPSRSVRKPQNHLSQRPIRLGDPHNPNQADEQTRAVPYGPHQAVYPSRWPTLRGTTAKKRPGTCISAKTHPSRCAAHAQLGSQAAGPR